MEKQDVFWFDEIGQKADYIVGKKCANLGELTRIKMPVPPGFSISIRAEERFLKETGALREIQELLSRVGDLSNVNLQIEVSEQIRNIVEEKEIPPNLHDVIVSYYQELCRKLGQEVAVSVRSAGAKSHPGQYETYLNIKGKQRVLEVVKKVWSSIFNVTTIANLVQLGLPVTNSPAIGVGVVKMVDARSAGVCLTVHPMTGDPLKALIEANWGLGESVVSGRVNTDRYVLDKESLKVVEKTLGEKRMQVVPKGEGVVEDEMSPEKQNTYALTDEEAVEIVKLGKALESHFKQPQDLEWAIDANCVLPYSVVLLQTRPVVGVKIRKLQTAEQKVMDEVIKRFF